MADSAPGDAIGNRDVLASLDGEVLRRVTEERGNHSVSFNADGTDLRKVLASELRRGSGWLVDIIGTGSAAAGGGAILTGSAGQ